LLLEYLQKIDTMKEMVGLLLKETRAVSNAVQVWTLAPAAVSLEAFPEHYVIFTCFTAESHTVFLDLLIDNPALWKPLVGYVERKTTVDPVVCTCVFRILRAMMMHKEKAVLAILEERPEFFDGLIGHAEIDEGTSFAYQLMVGYADQLLKNFEAAQFFDKPAKNFKADVTSAKVTELKAFKKYAGSARLIASLGEEAMSLAVAECGTGSAMEKMVTPMNLLKNPGPISMMIDAALECYFSGKASVPLKIALQSAGAIFEVVEFRNENDTPALDSTNFENESIKRFPKLVEAIHKRDLYTNGKFMNECSLNILAFFHTCMKYGRKDMVLAIQREKLHQLMVDFFLESPQNDMIRVALLIGIRNSMERKSVSLFESWLIDTNLIDASFKHYFPAAATEEQRCVKRSMESMLAAIWDNKAEQFGSANLTKNVNEERLKAFRGACEKASNAVKGAGYLVAKPPERNMDDFESEAAVLLKGAKRRSSAT